MSGTHPHLGVFCSPAFTEIVPIDGPTTTSILEKALSEPPFQGLTQFMPIYPAINPEGQMIAPLAVFLVRFPTVAMINDLDAVPDVYRLSMNLTEQQITGLETTLTRIAQQNIELSKAASLEQMTSRVVMVINPTYPGFPPGWFD